MSGAFLRAAWRDLRDKPPTITTENEWVYAEAELPAEESTFGQPTGEPLDYGSHETRFSTADDSIRLLELSRGDIPDPIRCSLRVHSLGDCPDYEALSYCWGDAADTLPITINDRTLSVTSNLRSALRHLRHSHTSRSLWVDAICINQADPHERSAQVAVMGDIYSTAGRTVIWLGPSDWHSSKAFRMLALLGHEDVGTAQEDELKSPSNLSATDQSRNVLRDTQDLEALRGVVQYLMDRPWFNRVWVVQEVALAKDAQVVCGPDALDWNLFVSGINKGLAGGFLTKNILGFLPNSQYDNALAIANAKHVTRSVHGPAERLLHVLHSYRGRNAADPVDKVYSLLKLVGSDVSIIGITPDYTRHYMEVYKTTALIVLQTSSDLDILGMCEPPMDKENSISLPSWVPDWSVRASNVFPRASECDGYFQSNDATRGTKKEMRLSADRNTLLLSGHVADSIADTSECLQPILNESNWFDEKSWEEPVWEDVPEIPADASLAQFTTSFFRDNIPRVYRELSSLLASTFDNYMRPVELLECFVRWEAFAKLCQKSSKFKSPLFEDPTSIYWRTLCAGNRLIGGDKATEATFVEWRKSLSATRNLLKLRANMVSKAYKPVALAGYIQKT